MQKQRLEAPQIVSYNRSELCLETALTDPSS